MTVGNGLVDGTKRAMARFDCLTINKQPLIGPPTFYS